MGLNLRFASNARPLDLRAEPDVNPVAALYLAGKRDVILRVPLRYCVTGRLLAFSSDTSSAPPSPFVETLQAYARQQCNAYQGSPLEAFYERFTPKTAAQFMGLANPTHAALNTLSPLAAIAPWSRISPEVAAQKRRAIIESEARQHHAHLSASDGHSLFGPISPAKGQLEFSRLAAIYDKIRSQGLRIDLEGFNNIRAECLLGGRSSPAWRFLVSGGHHRVAALTALACKTVDLQLRPMGLIRRQDASCWPAVRNGYLTQSEALVMFDRLAAGRQPWQNVAALKSMTKQKHSAVTTNPACARSPVRNNPAPTRAQVNLPRFLDTQSTKRR